MVLNCAFVFIKPHAVNDKVKELVKASLESKKIEIKKEGSIDAVDIDKKMLIDNHYYAIASKATILTPDKLPVPMDKFKQTFDVEWPVMLKENMCLNAQQACEKFEIDADKLDEMWGKAKKAGDMIKFGGGFYCGKLTSPKDGDAYFVFNGFFMTMRSKFVQEGASIYYYNVEWESDACSWEDFRGKVLGPTDPADAPKDSLRGEILARWKDLGLASEPNTGDNGVHASASPFEALAERMNWLGYRAERDPFGKLVLRTGASPKQIREWAKDPQHTYGPMPITVSFFDALEDTNADECLARISMMNMGQADESDEKMLKELEALKKQLEAYKPLEKAVLTIQNFLPSKAITRPVRAEKQEKKKDTNGDRDGSNGREGKGKGGGKGRRGRDEYDDWGSKGKRGKGGKGWRR